MTGTDPMVEVLGEPLEIDVGRIHVREELRAGSGFRYPAVTATADAALAAGVGHVDRVLEEDHGIVVGERDRAAPEADGRLGEPVGRGRVGEGVDLPDFEMSQFWQNRQARLHPAVPNESIGVPGRKWFRGFFSIGSTQKPDDRPYVVNTISCPRACARSRVPAARRSWRTPADRRRIGSARRRDGATTSSDARSPRPARSHTSDTTLGRRVPSTIDGRHFLAGAFTHRASGRHRRTMQRRRSVGR